MKKNGFIATSLLYSFFLIFISAIVSLIAILLHNKISLNKITNTVKDDLTYLNKKTIMNVNEGEYVKMPLFSLDKTTDLSDTLWIVTGSSFDFVSLISAESVFQTNKHNNINTMQDELDKYYNNFTVGFEVPEYHNVTYLNKSELDRFENDYSSFHKTIILGNRTNNSYIYYDDSINQFKLRSYCGTGCNPYNNNLSSGASYNLRMHVFVSDKTPIRSGRGLHDDPYVLAFYDYSNENLKLHYDYKNNTGNMSSKKDSFAEIVDLSGTNNPGTISERYLRLLGRGIRIIGDNKINTNLNANSILAGNYTIEFNTNDNFILSTTSKLDGIIISVKVNDIVTLNVMGSSYIFSHDIKTNNTISLVKEGTSRKIYYNGNEVDSFPAITAQSSDVFFIGSTTGGEKTFRSVRIYNRGLTAEEIKSNYDVDKRWL